MIGFGVGFALLGARCVVGLLLLCLEGGECQFGDDLGGFSGEQPFLRAFAFSALRAA